MQREGEYGGADVAERRLIMGANRVPLERGHHAFAERGPELDGGMIQKPFTSGELNIVTESC